MMFNWLRNLFKNKDDQRQERLTAYLDGALPANEQKLVEQELAQDTAWRAEMEVQQRLKYALRQLPRQPVPRNFILDPTRYAQRRPSMAAQIYPSLRLATAVMTVLLVGVIALDWGAGATREEVRTAASPAMDIAQVEMAEEMEVMATMVVIEAAEDSSMTDGAEDEEEMMQAFALETANETDEGEMSAAGAMMEEPAKESEDLAEDTATEPPSAAEAVMAPRPTPTANMESRMADPSPSPAVTATAAPTPTSPAPLPAQTELIETTPITVPNQPLPRPPWRTVQLILGVITAVLLAATLLLRRRL